MSLFLNNTIDLGGSCPSCKDGVEAVDAISDVENGLACEVVLVLHDNLVVNLVGEAVLDAAFQIADGQVVGLTEVGRVLQVLDGLFHCDFILVT